MTSEPASLSLHLGALRSAMQLTLHTHRAARVWHGRAAAESRPGIIGLNGFVAIMKKKRGKPSVGRSAVHALISLSSPSCTGKAWAVAAGWARSIRRSRSAPPIVQRSALTQHAAVNEFPAPAAAAMDADLAGSNGQGGIVTSTHDALDAARRFVPLEQTAFLRLEHAAYLKAF